MDRFSSRDILGRIKKPLSFELLQLLEMFLGLHFQGCSSYFRKTIYSRRHETWRDTVLYRSSEYIGGTVTVDKIKRRSTVVITHEKNKYRKHRYESVTEENILTSIQNVLILKRFLTIGNVND